MTERDLRAELHRIVDARCDAAYARGLDAGRAEQRDLVARMREAMRHAVGADYEEAWDEALGEFDDILAGLPPEAGIERAMGEYGAAYARGLREGARLGLEAAAAICDSLVGDSDGSAFEDAASISSERLARRIRALRYEDIVKDAEGGQRASDG